MKFLKSKYRAQVRLLSFDKCGELSLFNLHVSLNKTRTSCVSVVRPKSRVTTPTLDLTDYRLVQSNKTVKT